ncbi:MAG: hypothetical protein HY067_14105 [Betaproteobacteria bacterium]|nr:hypothetical protein [Betaproteobacteria bacterium]
MNFSDPVMAALIGATATFAAALFQLLVNARRQAAERTAGKPASRKTGTWLAIFALMLAAAVGGYALAEYQTFRDRDGDKVLRQEMQTRLRDIGNAAVRLERAGLQRSDQTDADARLAAERRHGAEGVVAVIGLPPCINSQSAPESSAGCNEGSALHASVCALIPAAAVVTEVQVFTRLEDSRQPWPEARVQPGQDAGAAKFVDAFYERIQADGKEVCQRFVHWNSQKARLARILVKYAP